MKLFTGLGNPGASHAGNRHNIGFMALDRIAADHSFGPWRAKFQGLASEGVLGGEKIVLLKPQTYMNLSGQSVQAALAFYKLDPADLVVFHDELDLKPGQMRVKLGGGHAGHNGLRSIAQHLGPDYWRVRLGIGHPGHKDRVSGHVLSDFAKSEQDWLEALLAGLSDGAAMLAKGDSVGFANRVALRLTPARKPAPQAGPAPRPAAAPAPATDTRTPLQRLMDRFK